MESTEHMTKTASDKQAKLAYTLSVTNLHKTSLMSRFLHVQYQFVEYSVCYKLVRTGCQYYFFIQSYGILNTTKITNLKAQTNEKMAEKEPYVNIIKTILKKSSTIMYKNKYFESVAEQILF